MKRKDNPDTVFISREAWLRKLEERHEDLLKNLSYHDLFDPHKARPTAEEVKQSAERQLQKRVDTDTDSNASDTPRASTSALKDVDISNEVADQVSAEEKHFRELALERLSEKGKEKGKGTYADAVKGGK